MAARPCSGILQLKLLSLSLSESLSAARLLKMFLLFQISNTKELVSTGLLIIIVARPVGTQEEEEKKTLLRDMTLSLSHSLAPIIKPSIYTISIFSSSSSPCFLFLIMSVVFFSIFYSEPLVDRPVTRAPFNFIIKVSPRL